ncbi:hypothetical protein [Pimelobacter sp. 30-1]|uniref:hypothetical protein n=1 Tax=Pimelobacter sp. 30-1 TaxID=2004991 RepID=UPI001C05BF1E|nr:hypothetical protein [Pimelobacter sp. 30-1]MBU2694263.1 hypothetical protein [Pimelobacter sp. 30-1]
MQDIKDVLDAELHTPPAPTFDVATTLGAGRRAVRRRRLAAGGAALALALVVGGAGVAVTSQFTGGQGTDPVQVAAGVSDEGLASTDRLVDESPAGYDPQDDDVILVRSGWEVVERVEDPVTGMSPAAGGGTIADSTGLALRKGATTTWVVLWRSAEKGEKPTSQGGGGAAETEAKSGYDTLTGWLDHQKTLAFTGTAR